MRKDATRAWADRVAADHPLAAEPSRRLMTITLRVIPLVVAAACARPGAGPMPGPPARALCSDSWYRSLEETVPTSDAHGHGPDVGSDEWKSTVEFRLGIRGDPTVPRRDSDAWCRHVDQLVRARRTAAGGGGQPRRAAGPVRFICDGDPANEVVVTFFQTDPPTAVAERGDSVSLMYLQPSGSGAKYQGRNETFWEHHGEALITWGHGAPEMRCRRAP